MQGQLHEIDLSNLLRLIEAGQRTGDLWLDSRGLSPWKVRPLRLQEGHTWLLTFIRGQLVHASKTSDRDNRLEDSLQRLNIQFPGPDVVFQYSTDHHSPEYEILWLLLEQQQIRPDQGYAVLRQLCEETLFELASLRQGSFCFERSTQLPPHFTTLPIAPLLRRLEQRLSQWQQLYPIIASPSQCPLLLDREAVQARLPSQAFVALDRWADGQTSILKLARRLNRHPASVARAIYPYIKAKFIKLQAQELTDFSPPPQEPESSTNLQSHSSSSEVIQQEAPKILCIDSQTADLNQLETILVKSGYQIQAFSDPLEALPALFKTLPDLIIANLDMVGLNGDDLCSMWRQSPQLRQIPIIMSMESQNFIPRTRAKMAGATDYLMKPLNRDELLMLLEKYIRPVPSPRPVFSEVWRSDALQGKLGHDNGEAKFTSTN